MIKDDLMKKKIIALFFIGGIIATFFELHARYIANIFLTHSTDAIIKMLIKAFFEGSILFSILTWGRKLRFQRIWKCYILYLILLVLYYFVRMYTVTFSVFMSLLPLLLIVVIISKIPVINSYKSTDICIMGLRLIVDIIIDVALLLLVFYPLLTLANKWIEKKESSEDNI